MLYYARILLVIINEIIFDSQHIFLGSIDCNGITNKGMFHQKKDDIAGHDQVSVFSGDIH